MSNDYFVPTGSPATSSAAISSTMRNEFNSIEDGFDKLPELTGNSELPLAVNTGATALEAVAIATFLARLGLNPSLETFVLPADTTISAFMKTVLDDVNALTARATLGLEIGSAVQAYDSFLESIAALGTGADKMVYTTGVNAAAETVLTAFVRTLLDDADAAAFLTTLGIDTDISTLSLPANTTITDFVKTVLDDIDAAAVRATIGAIANVDEDTTPQLSGELDCRDHSVGFTQQTIAYSAGTTTIDWKLGNKAAMTFSAGNIITFSFTNPTKPCNLLLKIVQDTIGSRVVGTWDTDIKWPSGVAPTLSTGANAVDIIAFYFDGVSYFGVDSLDFQ